MHQRVVALTVTNERTPTTVELERIRLDHQPVPLIDQIGPPGPTDLLEDHLRT
jgi:hypothetical protein